MLSPRGQSNANQLSIPWRFALSATYDRETNPDGLISFATAENVLVGEEVEEFARKVCHTSNLLHLVRSRTLVTCKLAIFLHVCQVCIPAAAFRYAYCTAGGPRLPAAFAAHVNEYFDPYMPVGGEDVKVTAAATALHDVLAYSICGAGEAILTTRPYYGRFEIDFGNKAGVKVVAADTDHENCFDESVVHALGEKLEESRKEGVVVRAVLIVNPHNPLGTPLLLPTLPRH
jgi:1-aminocyclopropane-1-carboxylate synthase